MRDNSLRPELSRRRWSRGRTCDGTLWEELRMEPIRKQVKAVVANILAPIRDPFSRDSAGLPEATGTVSVEVRQGDVFELRAAPVRKRIGDATVKMLAYNGSVPGSTLRVAQGS